MTSKISRDTWKKERKVFCETYSSPEIKLILILFIKISGNIWSSLPVQQVKDPVLSLQWPGSMLWWGFEPWPRNFHMPQGQPKKKKNKKKKASNITISFCIFQNLTQTFYIPSFFILFLSHVSVCLYFQTLSFSAPTVLSLKS